MKLFVIEDSPLIRDKLRVMATGAGLEWIGEADSEFEAAKGVFALDPDVVILDIKLAHEGSGLNLLPLIKLRRGVHTEVIVLSNHPQYKQKCLEMGADYFFNKSSDIDDLGELLGQLAHAPSPKKYQEIF